LRPALFSIFDVLTLVAPYILQPNFVQPGHGPQRRLCDSFEATQVSAAGFRFYDPQTIE